MTVDRHQVHIHVYILPTNIWVVTLLSYELQQRRHALAWLHQAAGLPLVEGMLVYHCWGGGGGCTISEGDTGRCCQVYGLRKVCKERVTSFRAMVDSVGQEPSLSDVRLLAVSLVAL